jgi:hypothetical protein
MSGTARLSQNSASRAQANESQIPNQKTSFFDNAGMPKFGKH